MTIIIRASNQLTRTSGNANFWHSQCLVLFSVVLMMLCLIANSEAIASDKSTAQSSLLVKKQRFDIQNFQTFGGENIEQVSVGWESYGKLNKDKSNVILITHYFTGNSHAAGKYQESDTTTGYWDSIIGPNKAIDTNTYFVISVDSLANLSVHDPNVITTGPASINPRTNKPYGLSFPVLTIRDFVNVQKAVLESLGIASLYAVIGPSMGSMQAIDWAAAYPEWVPRMISVIGSAGTDAWTNTKLEQWAIPIKLDKHWQQGNYYGKTPPTDGLVASLMFITQAALHPEFFNQVGENSLSYSPMEAKPLHSIHQTHSIVNWLKERAAARAKTMDANHLLYLVRANQLFSAGQQEGKNLKQNLASIRAKTLFLPASSDLLLMPYLAEDAHQLLKELNKDTQLTHLEGNLGHLEGVSGIAKHASHIRVFLSN